MSGADLMLRGCAPRGWAQPVDDGCDVRIRAGAIAEVGAGLALAGEEEVDARGAWFTPGLVDLCCSAREPGHEQDEDFASLGRAAAAGGYVAVVVSPDTAPCVDDQAGVELVVRRARDHAACEILPMGALTHQLAGGMLAPMGEMAEAGAVLFGDADRPVASTRLLRRAMEYARTFDRGVVTQPVDADLAANGVMHEGNWSTRLGLRGIPAAAEHIAVARDLAVCQLAGGRLHLARLSARRSVDHVARARHDGVAVSCAVTPWHLFHTHADLATYDVNLRFAAPLRSDDDRRALLAGLRDGTIDAVCSDHQPWGLAEKEVEFDRAAPGAIGIQTAFSALCDLVREGDLDLATVLRATIEAPRRVLGRGVPALTVGCPATFALLDPTLGWALDATTNRSRSRNSPWWGRPLRGRARLTVVGGRVAWRVPGHEGL